MSTETSRRTRFRLSWRWLLVPYVPLFALVAYMRTADPIGDEGMNNVVTMMVAALSGGLFLVWFAFFSGATMRTRLTGLGSVAFVVVALNVLFDVRGVSGSMIPEVRWAFGEDAPPTAFEEEATEREVDLASTSSFDWPGLAGPDRTQVVTHTQLARDWSARGPEVLWKRPVGVAWSSFAVAHGLAVTQEQADGQEWVRAYDLQNGALVWSRGFGGEFAHELGDSGPRSTPQIADGRVVALFPDGRLVCLDVASGESAWEVELKAAYGVDEEYERAHLDYGRSNSPWVQDGLVIVPVGGEGERGAGLAALKLEDGAEVWRSPARVPSFASPMRVELGGQEQILIVNEDTLSGHDPSTGALLWEHDWMGKSAGDSNNSQPIVIGGDRVFVSRGYGGGCLLFRVSQDGSGAWSTETVWTSRRSMRTKMTSPVARDAHVYGLSDGILECIELDGGQRVWKDGRFGHGQLLLVGDLLVVMSEYGELNLVEASPASEGEVLASFQLFDTRCWNMLAMYGDRLVVRSQDEAACVRLPVVGGGGEAIEASAHD